MEDDYSLEDLFQQPENVPDGRTFDYKEFTVTTSSLPADSGYKLCIVRDSFGTTVSTYDPQDGSFDDFTERIDDHFGPDPVDPNILPDR